MSVSVGSRSENERGAERLLRFTDRHPVLAVVLPLAALVSVYLTWSVASAAPVFVPEQAMNKCLAQAQRGDEGVSIAWELVPPRWNCVFYDRNDGIERRVQLKIDS